MVASMLPLRNNGDEAAVGLAASVQGNQIESVHSPAESEAGKSRRNASPVGWFSDRRRIPAHSGIQVARFQVWQDLSSSAEGVVAPLHAAITLELSNEWYLGLSRPNGVIRIENVRRGEIIEAGLTIHQANYSLESAQSAHKRQLQFVMSPTPPYTKLNAGETMRGVAQMKFWNRKVTILLPETSILLIR